MRDDERQHRGEIRFTNVVMLAGTVLFWAFIGKTLARVFRVW